MQVKERLRASYQAIQTPFWQYILSPILTGGILFLGVFSLFKMSLTFGLAQNVNGFLIGLLWSNPFISVALIALMLSYLAIRIFSPKFLKLPLIEKLENVKANRVGDEEEIKEVDSQNLLEPIETKKDIHQTEISTEALLPISQRQLFGLDILAVVFFNVILGPGFSYFL